jgi:hypothetical protein
VNNPYASLSTEATELSVRKATGDVLSAILILRTLEHAREIWEGNRNKAKKEREREMSLYLGADLMSRF